VAPEGEQRFRVIEDLARSAQAEVGPVAPAAQGDRSDSRSRCRLDIVRGVAQASRASITGAAGVERDL
jgi:hypothetical protein